MIIQKIILYLLLQSILGYKVSDFSAGFFHTTLPEGFYEVTTGNDLFGQIMAFADINGDQYNDYIGVPNRAQKIISVFLWNNKQQQFVKNQFSVTKDIFKQIKQVLICDLNSDGRNQIAVVFQLVGGFYEMEIYIVEQCQAKSCVYTYWHIDYTEFKDLESLPFFLDLQSDGKPQIFIVKQSKRYIVILSGTLYEKKQLNAYLQTPVEYKPLKNHFASIIDYNGDCSSDLILVSEGQNSGMTIQFYQKLSKQQYKFEKSLNLTKRISFMTFADLDNNGLIDLVLSLEENFTNTVYIAYNENQVPEKLCKKNDKFPFDTNHLIKVSFLSTDNKNILNSITSLVFGQVNNDGFPDMIVIANDSLGKSMKLFMNTLQNDTLFFRQDLRFKNITIPATIQQAAFFDFAQDGQLDIILTSLNQQNNKIERKAIINNLKEDTLFIKILPLSPSSDYQAGSTRISNSFGVTIQWLITTLQGSKKVQLLNQKFQWNFQSLQLPFALGGLGRTNNYLQDLTIGYEGLNNQYSWTPIIPNSQLMVYRQQQSWKLETLLANNNRVYNVIYISIAILILLGIVIFIFNYKQNQEDRQDHYNFIQLIR